jgi:DNA-binding transcriptional regulator YdaS (Cro superfamily)
MSQALAALDRAIAKYGSQRKLGDRIGYSQNAIHRARAAGRVSPRMAAKIDAITHGEIPKEVLCPGAFGSRRQVMARKWNGAELRKAS